MAYLKGVTMSRDEANVLSRAVYEATYSRFVYITRCMVPVFSFSVCWFVTAQNLYLLIWRLKMKSQHKPRVL